jgi:hypothetical protein
MNGVREGGILFEIEEQFRSFSEKVCRCLAFVIFFPSFPRPQLVGRGYPYREVMTIATQ